MHILWKLLFISVFHTTALFACPSGFVNETDVNCYSAWSSGPQFLAYKECALNSGVMFDIHNAFENNYVRSMATGKDKIWLGLTCLSNSPSSCFWDSGRQLKNGDYTNFFGGPPNADIGACVYMKVSTGQWFSSDCTQTTASSQCLYRPDLTVPTCPDNAIYFRGKCYYSMLQYDFARAEMYCSWDCGHLASIHSAGENSFVRDVSRLVQSGSYTFLGLQPLPNGSYNWTDGTPYDYNNFGTNNVATNSCAVLDQQDSGAKNGQWFGSDCVNPLVSVQVCKKDLSTTCDRNVAQRILPPAQCENTYHTSGAGTIFSPSYPSGSLANNCEYVISTVRKPTVIFTDLSLDENSHIYLFSGSSNNTMFADITNTSTFPLNFTSNTNQIRLLFVTTGGPRNYFRAEYGDGTVGLPMVQRTDFYYNGTITSPGYPNEYLVNTMWTYVLHSDKDRIEINFSDAYPYPDNIFVNDFNGQTLVFFYRIDQNLTVSSYMDTVWIQFLTKEPQGYRGFKAEFWSVY